MFDRKRGKGRTTAGSVIESFFNEFIYEGEFLNLIKGKLLFFGALIFTYLTMKVVTSIQKARTIEV